MAPEDKFLKPHNVHVSSFKSQFVLHYFKLVAYLEF
jgi:hypothetical protein